MSNRAAVTTETLEPEQSHNNHAGTGTKQSNPAGNRVKPEKRTSGNQGQTG
ncbi:hypothetical protein [Kibdelosporangium philippinense]|uniref:hypothetical protein n=1 Tax=Kibdelosporangium philippinense TaxID=211113 RepID=UPI00360FF599